MTHFERPDTERALLLRLYYHGLSYRDPRFPLKPLDGKLDGEVYRFKLRPGVRRLRLDLYLDLIFRGRSRSYWKKMIEKGVIRVDDQVVKTHRKVGPDDEVSINIDCLGTSLERDNEKTYTLLYQDDHVVAVSKRAGAFSHPVGRLHRRSVVNELREEVQDDRGLVSPVHRLDRFVSGLILHTRGPRAARILGEQFMKSEIDKEYLALVHGEVQGETREICLAVGKATNSVIRIKMGVDPEGKPSTTHVRVVERFPAYTLVTLRPETGRRHQLRLHMAEIGHPIVNDPLYGEEIDVDYFERQQFDNHDDAEDGKRWIALHSHSLTFKHPDGRDERMTIEAPLTGEFLQMVTELRSGKAPQIPPTMR